MLSVSKGVSSVRGKMIMRQSSSLISITNKPLHLCDRRCFAATANSIRRIKEAEVEAKPVFYVPRTERSNRSVFSLDARMGEERLTRSDRLCPTRELNYTPAHWKRHKNPFRRLRHVSYMLLSSPFQRLLFPDLTMVAVISGALTYYNEIIATAETAASISAAGFGGATTAIGLLAGFRLNTSYGRYEECRIFWGDTNNTIRDLARETMMWMKDKDQQSRMLKLCKAYPVALNFHLNAKGGHHNIQRTEAASVNMAGDSALHLENGGPGGNKVLHSFDDRIHAEFKAELRDIYLDGKHEEDFQRICDVKYKGGNTPLEMLTLMGETIAGSVGTVDAIYVREMDEQCQRLCAAFGASERVLRTPLPTGFTRHSSRLLLFWSSALPFALYPAMGPVGTLPTAVFTSWAILGIEDIGVQLEEPFDILPMRQYSDGMFDAINQVERNYTPYTPPSVSRGEVA